MKISFSKFEHRSLGRNLNHLILTNETAKIYRRRNLPVNELIGQKDLLGEPSGKYNYYVWCTKPESADTPFSEIKPTGWGEEFFEEDSVSIFYV